jgi:streptomycin 6-kinase
MASLEDFEPWLGRWSLIADGEGFTTRFGCRLLPVRAGGERAMLKIAVHEEERRGGALMAWWGGIGAARVLAREDEAILLERLDGPRSLAAMARAGEDDEATCILCHTAMALHAPRPEPPPASLTPMEVWFRALWPAASAQGGTLALAASAARDLLDDPRDIAVLHGDYHHDNVLDGGERGWLVIDPKGVLGERGFEYANLFRNPDAPTVLMPGRLGRQAAIVARAASLDVDRLLAWILAYAGLGAAWSLESGDQGDAAVGLAIAEAAAALRPA